MVCFIAWPVVSALVALSISPWTSVGRASSTCVRIVVMGMSTISSWSSPKGELPFSSSTPRMR